MTETTSESPKKLCPYCNSQKVKKYGWNRNVKDKAKLQRFKCNDCGHTFY